MATALSYSRIEHHVALQPGRCGPPVRVGQERRNERRLWVRFRRCRDFLTCRSASMHLGSAIGDDHMPKAVYHAYGYVKKAAALVNAAAGRLEKGRAALHAENEAGGGSSVQGRVRRHRSYCRETPRIRKSTWRISGLDRCWFVTWSGASWNSPDWWQAVTDCWRPVKDEHGPSR